MAKVLACPACGNKHPLELLVGLDSFQCRNCGKKLAVPIEVNEMFSPKQTADSESVLVKSSVSADDQELKVVARSTISQLEPVKVASSKEKDGVLESKQPEKSQTQPRTAQTKPKAKVSSSMKLGAFSKLLSWFIALPLGFFVVVILPRLFGRGFHASDFVEVITNQGIGKYDIVVSLVFFWSIATVAFIPLINIALDKFIHLGIFKKKTPAG